MRRPLLDSNAAELASWMAERGFPRFHAGQVVRWVFEKRAGSFASMSDLPARLREALEADWSPYSGRIASHGIADDGTEKLLIEWPDGRKVECVLMAESDRRTACLSTQVGCGMGCVFCASGLKGVERNLTAGEIIEQALRLRDLLPADERLTNVVVMGMGESLANLANLAVALDRLCAPEGLGLSQRKVTISTVGLPEKIRELARLDRQYHLAVSLHAPTPDLRDELVPINEKVGLDAVMAAADDYFRQTGRQITYEYVLLKNINDRPEHAEALAALLSGRKAHANLIPYNPVPGLPFEGPDPADCWRFAAILGRRGVSATVRKTKGRRIDAACGQLRRRTEVAAVAGG